MVCREAPGGVLGGQSRPPLRGNRLSPGGKLSAERLTDEGAMFCRTLVENCPLIRPSLRTGAPSPPGGRLRRAESSRPTGAGERPGGGGGAFRSSVRQTDFQTLRAMKIGPLPCGGHASSAIPQGHWLHKPLVSSRCVAGVGGAVSARPLIRHGLWPCHLLPSLRQPFFAPVGREKRAAALPQPRFFRRRRRFGCRPPRGKARIKMRPCLPTTSVMCRGRLDCRFWQLRAGCHSQGQPHSPIL